MTYNPNTQQFAIRDDIPIENQFGLVLTADGFVGQGEAPDPPAQQQAATDNTSKE